jgi:hypothetical protein
LAQRLNGGGKRHSFLVEIRIEVRQRGETVVDLDVDLRRTQSSERTQQLTVRRARAKTAGDREEPHPET